jgi:hypothetical protein
MKRIIILGFFALLFMASYSQDEVTHQPPKTKIEIGINSGFGFCKFSSNQDHTEIVSAHGKTVVPYGLNFMRIISRKIELETGIIYTKYTNVNHVIFDGLNFYATENFNVISVPILLRYYFIKNYYLNGGTILDFGFSKGPYKISRFQNGFGLSVGAGKSIPIGKFSLSVAANYCIHSEIEFNGKSKLRIFEPAIKLGLDYKI